MKTVIDLLDEFTILKSRPVTVRLNHYNLLIAILDCCHIPLEAHAVCSTILEHHHKPSKWAQTRLQLIHDGKLSKAMVDSLETFDFDGKSEFPLTHSFFPF